jgi:SAM-dependent methyltransferase
MHALDQSGFARCADKWTFVHKEPHELASKWGIDNMLRQIRGDLRLLQYEFPKLGGQFDMIFCNAVLEHVEDPFSSMRSLAFLLAPGGALWVGVPFITEFHGGHYFNYPDFWRISTQGLTALAHHTGLQAVALNVTGVGPAFVAGQLLGMGLCEFEEEDLLRHAVGGRKEVTFSSAVLIGRKHPSLWKPANVARECAPAHHQRRVKGVGDPHAQPPDSHSVI